MPVEQLTFEFGDGDVLLSPDGFKDILACFLEIIHMVECGFAVSGMTVQWKLTHLSMHSPIKLGTRPDVRYGPTIPKGKISPMAMGNKIADAVFKGISALEKPKATPKLPSGFSIDAAKAVQKLFKAADKEGAKVSVGTSKKLVPVTATASKNVDALVAKMPEYADLSTIEGTLEVVNARDRNYFVLWETLTNYRIECFANEATLLEAAKRLNKRVSVTGRVRYKNNIPTSVSDIESVTDLPDDILRLEDIDPIDITGGIPPEEYVRRLRDA